MSLTFRPWREDDDLQLLEIFGEPTNPQQLNDRSMLGRNLGPGVFGHTMVAEDDGVAVAAATVFAQPLHPQRLWFYAEVAPEVRRRGIGSALLERLRGVVAEHGGFSAELKARSADDDVAAAGFLQAHGFGPIQHNRSVIVGAGVLELPELSETGPVLEDLATGSVELSGLVAEYYNSVHAWDPSEMRLTQAQKLLLAPETGAAGAVVLRSGVKKPIDAFAISYTAEQANPEHPVADVLLGWNPKLSEPEATARVRDILAMVAAQYPVYVEVDESMTALTPTIDQLLASGHASLNLATTVWATDDA